MPDFSRRAPITQADMDYLSAGANGVLNPVTPYEFAEDAVWPDTWRYELSRIRTDLINRTTWGEYPGSTSPSGMDGDVEVTDDWLISGPWVVSLGRTCHTMSFNQAPLGSDSTSVDLDNRQFNYQIFPEAPNGDSLQFICLARNVTDPVIYTGMILGTEEWPVSVDVNGPAGFGWANTGFPGGWLGPLTMRVTIDFNWTGGGTPSTSGPSFTSLVFTIDGVDRVADTLQTSAQWPDDPAKWRLQLDILSENMPGTQVVAVALDWAIVPYTGWTVDGASGKRTGFLTYEQNFGPEAILKVIHPRNEVARESALANADRTLVEANILDADSFCAALKSPHIRPIDEYVYNALDPATQAMVDAYPPLDPAFAAALVIDLNDIIEGDYFYTVPLFDGITLRRLTQWLIQVPDISGSLLELLNRLLLEDAYPSLIEQTVTAIVGAETEIAATAVHGLLNQFSDGSIYGTFGFQVEQEDADGIWMAKTLPPPALFTFLDSGLPQYYSGQRAGM